MTRTYEYRPIDPARDIDRAAELVSRAFGGTAELCRFFVERSLSQEWRVLARPGQPIDACAVFPQFGQYFGNKCVEMMGVAGVAVAPEARGRGLATQLMTTAIRELHSRGTPISTLYPATQPLYRRAGYEQAGSTFEHTIDLRAITPQRTDPALTIRPIQESDKPRIHELHRQHARDDGNLDRRTYTWNRIENHRGINMAGYLIEDDGSIEGWTYIHMNDSFPPGARHGTRQLFCTDVQAHTLRAAHKLIAFFADHASVLTEVTFKAGPRHPLGLILEEQRYKISLVDHWMMRIINPKAALEARGYPPHLNTTLTLNLQDDNIPTNNGRITLTIESGKAQVTPAPTHKNSTTPALTLNIRDLATLFTGFYPATTLATLNKIQGPEEALRQANAIFAGAYPAIAEAF